MANIFNLEAQVALLDEKFNDLEDAFNEDGGAFTEEYDAKFAALEEERAKVIAEIKAKPEGYMRWLKNAKADADMYKKAKEEIDRKKKSAEKKVDYITNLLTEAMLVNDLSELKEEGGLFKATLRTSTKTEYDTDTVVAPYRAQIVALAGELPAYISIETKILPSALEKGAPLPLGFEKVTNTKAQVR